MTRRSFASITLVVWALWVATVPPATAAITPDATSMTTATSTTLVSFSHVIGGGSNRLLVVCVATEDGGGGYDVTNVTYDGVSLTPAVQHAVGAGTVESTEIWYALEATLPAAGSHTIEVNAPGDPNEWEVGAASFSGVAQKGPEATAFNDVSGAGATYVSQSITTLTDGALVVDCVGSGNPGDFTPDPGQSEYFDTTIATSAGAGSYEAVPTAGATTQGVTFNGTGVRLSYTLAAFAPAVRSVYYSVGTSGANLMAGPTDVTISGGVATFTMDQPDNVGVGDEVLYGGTTAYISGRVSSRVYTLTTPTGLPAGDEVTPVAVTSIRRAFSDLNAANAGSSDVNHLGTTDLAGNDFQLNWPCYDDGPITTVFNAFSGSNVTGYTTGSDSYLRIYAPSLPTEVGTSQRHTGVAGSGFRLVPSVVPAAVFAIINVGVEHIRIEGIELDGSSVTNAQEVNGILTISIATAGSDLRFDRLLIHDLTNMSSGLSGFIKAVSIQDGNLKLSNSIFYDLTNNSTDTNAMVMGVELNEPTGAHFIYNNTIFDVKQAAASGGAQANGIVSWSGNTTVKNTFVGDVVSTSGSEFCFRSITTRSNNASSDGTAGAGGVTGQTSYASYFVNVTNGSENLHLLDSSINLWGISGADVDTDANLPITVDVDGELRNKSAPDVGADEISATPLYRSVGTNGAELTGGGLTVEVVGTTATLSAPPPANVGIGDVLQYQIGPTYFLAFVHRRLSDQSFLVASAAGGTPSPAPAATPVGIYRAYTSLANWELQNENPSIDISVSNFDTSTDLVTANTIMHVAGYADGAVGPVAIDWTTSAKNYVRLFVPRSAGEVGVSQRHGGVWDNTKFRVVGPGTVISVQSTHVRIDGVQVHSNADTLNIAAVEITGSVSASEYEVSNCIIRGFGVGSQDVRIGLNLFMAGSGVLKAWNNVIYDFDGGTTIVAGIVPDDPEFTFYLYNNTVVDNRNGIEVFGGTVIAKNNLVYSSSNNDYSGTFSGLSSDNLGGPVFNTVPGSNQHPGSTVSFVNFAGDDFHLASADTGAQNLGTDLSSDPNLAFAGDVDPALRQSPWDIGADDVVATTAVELMHFEAAPADGAVDLFWKTGSEMDNLGFNLYRALDPSGPFARITSRLVPGLGSSPEGARYRYRDVGLDNGTTYYYLLEDVETTGATERHGPVTATPEADAGPTAGSPTGPADGAGIVTFGTPETTELRVTRRGRRRLVVELTTGGFYAVPQEDGTLLLEVPGFQETTEAGVPALPVTRPWIDALGDKARILSVRAVDSQVLDAFPLSGSADVEIVALQDGTVRAARRGKRVARRNGGLFPETPARLFGTGFQGDAPKAQLELAPFQWHAASGKLLFARKLVVELAFASDFARGKRTERRRRRGAQDDVLARLAVSTDGLYGVRFEDVPGIRRATTAAELRLTRGGEPVAFHIAPRSDRFGPGSTLYFVSTGAARNPYADGAVFQLEHVAGTTPSVMEMERVDGRPAGPPVSDHLARVEREENHQYQPTLDDVSDLWTWDMLIAPQIKSYPFETPDALSTGEGARLSLHLKGTSDLAVDPDHHVRAHVNGTFVAEAYWDGKHTLELAAELPPGVLRDGATNVLELEAVSDTSAAYSVWMLNRFTVTYPRASTLRSGALDGTWRRTGSAMVGGIVSGQAVVVDVTGEAPVWLDNIETDRRRRGTVRFHVAEGHRYLVTESGQVPSPAIRDGRTVSTSLRARTEGADYLLVAPREFLDEAQPLLDHRERTGLHVAAVAMEDVYDEFGFGEATPEALRDFLRYAYHEWPEPSLRYVLLLGDGTYDFKDYLGTGNPNRVPPYLVRTPFLWTASDPTLAAVNGDDVLPDVAIGRLPAATEAEARDLVDKILAFEASGSGFTGDLVLVADNRDSAGDFRANAEDVAASVLRGRHVSKLYAASLGSAAVGAGVREAFNEGAALVSYVGHGGIHLWGAESFLDVTAVPGLAPQSRQPFVVTMNCLNGYFHFPYADSLSEALVKAEGKGAIAAFSPAGLSFDAEAHLYHKALLDAVFNRGHRRLGDAILDAQASYAATGAAPELLVIYHLLGDPALELE